MIFQNCNIKNVIKSHLLNLSNSPLVFPRTEYPPPSFLMENGNFSGLSSTLIGLHNCNVNLPFVSSNLMEPVMKSM